MMSSVVSESAAERGLCFGLSLASALLLAAYTKSIFIPLYSTGCWWKPAILIDYTNCPNGDIINITHTSDPGSVKLEGGTWCIWASVSLFNVYEIRPAEMATQLVADWSLLLEMWETDRVWNGRILLKDGFSLLFSSTCRPSAHWSQCERSSWKLPEKWRNVTHRHFITVC